MIKYILLACMVCTSSFAGMDISSSIKPDYSVISEECRQVALKLDFLSRYQERLACVTNLDGASVYVASQYILNYQLKEANALISKAVILTKFAIDIDCHGHDEMIEVVQRLESIQKKIAL